MGRDWGEKDFLPFLQCLFKEQHSSVKVTLLYAIQNVMEMDHLEEDLLPEKRMVIDALSVGHAYRITNRTWFPMSDLSPAESSRRHTHDFPKVSKQITSLHSILPRLDSSKTPSHGSWRGLWRPDILQRDAPFRSFVVLCFLNITAESHSVATSIPSRCCPGLPPFHALLDDAIVMEAFQTNRSVKASRSRNYQPVCLSRKRRDSCRRFAVVWNDFVVDQVFHACSEARGRRKA